MNDFAMPITPRQWALHQRAVVDIRFAHHTLRVVPGPAGTTYGLFPEQSHRTIHHSEDQRATGRPQTRSKPSAHLLRPNGG